MTHAEIRVFLALCEELHFGRTAERLKLPQSRVSRSIQSVEREIGGMLFERTSRKVALTPLGIQLRDQLRPAYERLSNAVENAKSAARKVSGVLRIGFTNTTAGPPLNRLLAIFESHHPKCEVKLHEVPMAAPYDALRHGKIDVLLNWLAVAEPDLTVGPAILHEPRILLVAADHELARRKTVVMNDLTGYGVACKPSTFPTAIDEALHPPTTPSGVPISRTHLARTFGELVTLVARGRIVHPTVASAADKLARDDIVAIPIVDLAPLPLGLIWCTARENGRIRALARVARSLPSKPTGSQTAA